MLQDIRRDMEVYEETYIWLKSRLTDKKWKKSRKNRVFYSTHFYCSVRLAGMITTPYMSLAASNLKKEPTPDHCFSPRLVFRAMMDICPEILRDREKFYNLIDFCRHTVKVTSAENEKVKYDDDRNGTGLVPIVYTRTIDKYDDFGWIQKGVGMLKENGVNSPFPLKHLVPDWLTVFEEKCMRHHGYL